mmetsp:Transcript_18706/g.51349  ORF Transcript_18706/g.51349 Transcript_18706/m.51349 type:complete len:270 (+) Transcript_18706:739-1548(+)
MRGRCGRIYDAVQDQGLVEVLAARRGKDAGEEVAAHAVAGGDLPLVAEFLQHAEGLEQAVVHLIPCRCDGDALPQSRRQEILGVVEEHEIRRRTQTFPASTHLLLHEGRCNRVPIVLGFGGDGDALRWSVTSAVGVPNLCTNHQLIPGGVAVLRRVGKHLRNEALARPVVVFRLVRGSCGGVVGRGVDEVYPSANRRTERSCMRRFVFAASHAVGSKAKRRARKRGPLEHADVRRMQRSSRYGPLQEAPGAVRRGHCAEARPNGRGGHR